MTPPFDFDHSLLHPGLPGDEFKRLKSRNRLAQVYKRPEDVYLRCSNLEVDKSPVPSPHSSRRHLPPAYRKQSSDARLKNSEIAKSTRTALGKSLQSLDYPTDASIHGSWSMISSVKDDQTQDPDRPGLADSVRDFNKRWIEDDEDNDVSQYLADMMPKAPWRKHMPLQPMYDHVGQSRNGSKADVTQEVPDHEQLECGERPVRFEPRSRWSSSTVATQATMYEVSRKL